MFHEFHPMGGVAARGLVWVVIGSSETILSLLAGGKGDLTTKKEFSLKWELLSFT
jgi:hypothetical protein